MGTNFYLEAKRPCKECGRPHKQMHIGKSSAGWCFSLHVIPEENINDLEDWERLWAQPGARIVDEYGTEVSADEMRDNITNRSWDRRSGIPFGYGSWARFYEQNHAAPGPNGLLRHKIEPGHCIAHGDGTWDCIVGEYS